MTPRALVHRVRAWRKKTDAPAVIEPHPDEEAKQATAALSLWVSVFNRELKALKDRVEMLEAARAGEISGRIVTKRP